MLKKRLPCLLVLIGTLLTFVSAAQAVEDCKESSWPAWQSFKQNYIHHGRVIDTSDKRQITTSEGQSYGLFFALVANDRNTFKELLTWTENNLAAGDLTSHLPAWVWGKHDSGEWGVLDANSASDSDLWIAYDLLEAGRLWNNHGYQSLGTLLLQRAAREEVKTLPGLGEMLLPGKVGFELGNTWRLNPSYQPPQLLARFSPLKGPWAGVAKSNFSLLTEGAKKGLAPDWMMWNNESGWQADKVTGAVGSYNAIRVYLWIGMMADNDPQKATLLAHYQPMAALTREVGVPPEIVNTAGGHSRGMGPIGFSAALLPFVANDPDLLAKLRENLKISPPGDNVYYSSVLALYGQGWDEKRYRFNRQGELLPAWSQQCTSTN